MLQYAFLGLLREQSDYGYRLKARFEERVGPVWSLNMGQVYQTLRGLEHSRFIAEVDGDQNPRYPARRMYEVTPRGRRFLDRWLHRPGGLVRYARDETLIRLLLLEPHEGVHAMEQIAQQQHYYRQSQTRLLTEKRKLPSEQPDGFVGHLGLEAALLHIEAHLKWLDYCVSAIARRKQAT
jgi:DNA-binding PadR family transcriptional regulator